MGQPFRIDTWKQGATVIVLALAFTTACSRQVVDASQRMLATSGSGSSPASNNSSSPTRALPDVVVPIGTPIVIRLQSAVSSATSHAGETFEATLDEPIVSQGETIVPRGAAVIGRVISARSSDSSQPGYLRLALSALRLDGTMQELHTSAVFAKGTSRGGRSKIGLQSVSASSKSLATAREVEFSTGRQLIFFLVQPLPVRE